MKPVLCSGTVIAAIIVTETGAGWPAAATDGALAAIGERARPSTIAAAARVGQTVTSRPR